MILELDDAVSRFEIPVLEDATFCLIAVTPTHLLQFLTDLQRVFPGYTAHFQGNLSYGDSLP